MWKFKISKRNNDSSRKLALEGNCVLTPVLSNIRKFRKDRETTGKIKRSKF